MQKWKVCKKLMAVILTLCMVLPLISNQYLVVRAEESGEGDGAISYTQVQSLKLGDNTITDDAPVVNYLNDSGEAAQWTDQVFQYTVPDTGDYGICMTYSGNSPDNWQKLTYYTCDDQGRMMQQTSFCTTSYNTPKEALPDRLENGKTYWFRMEYNSSRDSEEKVTTKDKMQDVTLTIVGNIPSLQDLKEKATVISGKTTDTFTDKDRCFLSTGYMVYYGKLYSVTLEPEEYIDVKVDQGSIAIYEYIDNGGFYVDSDDYTELDSYDGIKLQNKEETAKTYYVFAHMGALKAEFSDIPKPTPSIPIAQAELEEFKAGQAYDLSSLKKQKLQYDYLIYREETKEESNIRTIKSEGYWAKLTVPEGHIYQLSASSSYNVMKHDLAWDVYEGMYGSMSQQYELAEGTYYIYSDNDAVTIKITDLPDVSTIKEKAIEITDADVKNGQVRHDNGSEYYKYYSQVLDGKEQYQAFPGTLYKITIPTGKIYLLNGGVSDTAIVYDSDFKYIRNNGKIENQSGESKNYYVWRPQNQSQHTDTNMQIQVIESDLKDEKEKAAKMQLEETEKYQYTDTDATYISTLTYSYGNNIYTIENAKVYMLDSGIYTLNVKSENTDVNAKLYLFETDDLHVQLGDGGDIESRFSTKLDLSEERKIPIRLMHKGYVVISGDAEHLDAGIDLTLNKGEDTRLSVKNSEICELIKGDNECIKKSNPYLVVDKSDGYNHYSQLYGTWYKYHFNSYTEVEIKVPAEGDIYVFDNPEEPETAYWENYGGACTFRLKNTTEKAYDIYICVPPVTASAESKTIQVNEKSIASDISLKQDQATEIKEGSFITTKEGVEDTLMPDKYDADGTLCYSLLDGKLYKVCVASKQNVEIQYDATIIVYDNLKNVPVVKNDGTATFSNLSKGTKDYYIWLSGENDNKTGMLTMTPLQSSDNEDKKETTIPVSDSKTVIIEEQKDSNEATIKTSDTGISADIIAKSIEIANQYNSDNEGDTAKTKITSIQTTYTDDTNATIPKTVVEKIKSMDKTVDFEVSKINADHKVVYRWKMKADSIDSIADAEVVDINTKVEVTKTAANQDDEKKINELAKNAEMKKQVVHFAHDGKLPAKTEITVAVDATQFSGNTVYYFHFDKANGKLVYAGKADVIDGYVTMVLDHCSDYVIFDKNVACKHEKTKVRNAKEASCTEAGYTGDTYCVDCDTKLKTGEEIAKKAHTSSDWIIDKAATVDAEGSRHKECTVCKTVLAEEAIAKLPAPTPTPEPVVIPDVTIRYTTHVQTFGWQGDENNASKWFVNGAMAGTSGKAKRLEGIKIRVYGNDNLGIQYTTHCQSYGWLPWSANGEMNGTEGEAKRLEAIKIQLTGADRDKYDVYYRVHAQSYGWLGWAKNGAPSGTAGYAKRLEGIQIVVVKKGAAAPGVNYAGVNAASGVHQAKSYIAKAGSSPVVGNQATSNTNPSVAGEANVNVAYRTHVQTFGWQGWKYNGQMSGTSGQAKRLEGINIKLTNKPYSGSIVYTTHVQTYGWQGNENNPNTWRRDGDMSGTSGEAKRLEAIRIALTGEMAEHYDVYYRVHAQSFGWLGWAKNGEAAGTAGLAKRLEGIQIVLVPKGGNAPARSYQGITSVKPQAYIKK